MKDVKYIKMKRPVLKYHGSKYRIADWIISHFPAHDRYVEPFGGGGAVLMNKSPSIHEVYNDLDDDIVGIFRVLRDKCKAEELSYRLKYTPFSRTEYLASYQNKNDDEIERVRKLIIKSFMGFGSDSVHRLPASGFRSRSNRSNGGVIGNSPSNAFAQYYKMIEIFTDRLRGVVIENKNAIDVIRQYDHKDTLFYVDPPYVHSSRTMQRNGLGGYACEMTDQDHIELSEVLHDVLGCVVISGYQTGLYAELYSGWETDSKKVFADQQKQRVENVWLNPSCVTKLMRENPDGLFTDFESPE